MPDGKFPLWKRCEQGSRFQNGWCDDPACRRTPFYRSNPSLGICAASGPKEQTKDKVVNGKKIWEILQICVNGRNFTPPIWREGPVYECKVRGRCELSTMAREMIIWLIRQCM